MILTVDEKLVKDQSRKLKIFLKEHGIDIFYDECLHVISKSFGFENWGNTLAFFKQGREKEINITVSFIQRQAAILQNYLNRTETTIN
jgi:hypothetical protein